MAYPVIFDLDQQPKYDKMQVVIRILILIVLSILGGVFGWAGWLLYLAIPVLAAILISQKGAQRYFGEANDDIVKWLRIVAAFYSYMFLLTDRLPNEEPKQTLRLEISPQGEPTVGGVLLRIIYAIPHAIVLSLLGIVAALLALIAAIMVLVQESYPEGIFGFLRGYMRWHARVAAYMAGLVQDYPPFAFDTGPESPALPATAGDQPQTP